MLRLGPPLTNTSRIDKLPGGSGFTLIELLVTVSIAAILATIAVPSFIDFFRNTRLNSQTSDFVASLSLARSEAVRRGNRVTVCKSSNGTSCDTSLSWHQGWIVFSDVQDGRIGSASGTAVGTVDTGSAPADEVIRVFPALTNSTISTGTHITNSISFLPDASAVGSGGAVNDTVTFCNNHVSLSMTLNTSGRVSVATTKGAC